MNRRRLSLAAATAAGLLATTGALAGASETNASSPTFKGHQFAASARVSLAQARTLALKARPGVITDQELEKESGGSGLRYSFDVRSGGVTWEVGVDAVTGRLLETSREGKQPD
jgi:uncharacterized membrane protein YkoI